MLLTAWFQVGDVFNPCWLDPVRHFSEMWARAFTLRSNRFVSPGYVNAPVYLCIIL